MSKKQTFIVTLEFADKITTDDDVREIASNIVDGLVYVAEHEGIAPDESDTYTVSVEVKPQFSEEVFEKKIV